MTSAAETTELELDVEELAECEQCGDEFPENEAVDVCVHRQTLESPAEYVRLCPDCGTEPEPDFDEDDRRW